MVLGGRLARGEKEEVSMRVIGGVCYSEEEREQKRRDT